MVLGKTVGPPREGIEGGPADARAPKRLAQMQSPLPGQVPHGVGIESHTGMYYEIVHLGTGATERRETGFAA